MRANPGLYPASLWITLILIDIVLLLIDVWAIMALIKAIWPGDQSESDDEQRTVGEQGTAR
jgi:hypothetical protein